MRRMFRRVAIMTLNFSAVLNLMGWARAAGASDPWTKAQLISPEALNKLLVQTKSAQPLIIQVGFRSLYIQGHIPESVYYGPASRPEGLAELRKYVHDFPRHQEIVIYCGCCPWSECPNVRPAFKALKEMGFTRVKVLEIPDRLSTDWVAKGYPLDKGE
jgi:thiosulfate/3-mercaptopyruvate sulfurtransferase